jgi:hypothetical protein
MHQDGHSKCLSIFTILGASFPNFGLFLVLWDLFRLSEIQNKNFAKLIGFLLPTTKDSMKRGHSSSLNERNSSKKRPVISSSELYQKTMSGQLPFMRICSVRNGPSKRVLRKLHAIVASGFVSQKQIALENGLR